MRSLNYLLSNGTEVATLKEAKASNLKYKMVLRDIAEAKPQATPKREAMLNQFGYAHPKLKDRVVIE